MKNTYFLGFIMAIKKNTIMYHHKWLLIKKEKYHHKS